MNNAQNNIDGKFVNAGNGIFGEVLNVWNDGGDYEAYEQDRALLEKQKLNL